MPKQRATPQNHCFISQLLDPDGNPCAWKLDIRRSGKVHVHCFNFTDYADQAAALEAARQLKKINMKAHRNTKLKVRKELLETLDKAIEEDQHHPL